MERLTEYHNGVAVIRGKSKLKEAMRKLAGYEDAEEDSDMDKITTEFAEYICDNLCQFPEKAFDDEDLDECCDKCKMGKFICDILNTYNRLNTFVGSEVEKLMKKNAKLEKELQTYRNLEEQGLLHKAPFKIGQPIWIVGNELINDYVIRQFIVTEEGIEAVKISKEINGKEYWNTFYTESWLVYVFPTKAEAEKALEEMEK